MTDVCRVCHKHPNTRNNTLQQCSHADCPHRRKAWSERPTREQLFRGPWPKNVDADPVPLGEEGDTR